MTFNTIMRLGVLVLTLSLSLSEIFAAKAIIFDLGGVLLRTSKHTVIRKAGLMPLLLFTLRHGNPRKALFETLSEVKPFNVYPYCSFDEEGNELPGIFCDFMAGVPAETILEQAQAYFDEDDVLWQLTQCIFDPVLLAKSQCIIKSGKSFVKQCIKDGHDVYILSNWDTASFAILKKRHPDFFSLFKGIVISGDCHLLKPDPEIYQYFLDQFGLEAKNCVFIDNQPENIDSAEQLGITGIYCPASWSGKPNFRMVRRTLKDWLADQEDAAPAIN